MPCVGCSGQRWEVFRLQHAGRAEANPEIIMTVLFRGPFGKDALQGAAVHMQPASRL